MKRSVVKSFSLPFWLALIALIPQDMALPCLASKANSGEGQSTKSTRKQPLPEHDRAALDWCSGSSKPTAGANNVAAITRPSATNASLKPGSAGKGEATNIKPSNNHVASTAAPSQQSIGNQASGIGNLESIIKTIKQEQSTVDLKSIGDSIIILRRKITDNPQDPALRQRLGTLLYLAGDYEGAASELKHAIGLKPSNFVAHALLGRILADAGEREASSMEFHNAIALAPSVAATHYLYADSLVSRGDISEGINEYRRSIGIKPNASALTGLAEALMIAQDVDGAVKAARQAVSEEPNSAEAYVALTKALLLAGDTQSSARTAREALLLNPNLAASHIAVGRSLYGSGKIEAAAEEFKQAVALDPLNAEAHNDLGYALYGKGDISNALNEFRLALRLNPHLSEARNNLEIAIHALSGRKHN
jgi:tetratricopeptide (TPR) repeat protein